MIEIFGDKEKKDLTEEREGVNRQKEKQVEFGSLLGNTKSEKRTIIEFGKEEIEKKISKKGNKGRKDGLKNKQTENADKWEIEPQKCLTVTDRGNNKKRKKPKEF